MSDQSNLLDATTIQTRIFDEAGIVVSPKDPLFAFLSICRANQEALSQVLNSHEETVRASMEERVEVMTQLMVEGIEKLRDETLVDTIRSKVATIREQTLENQRIEETMSQISKDLRWQMRINQLLTGINILSLVVALTIFALLIK